MKALIFVLAAAVFLSALLVNRAYRNLPLDELRRRARARDSGASSIYKVSSYGEGLEILLWLLGSLSGAYLLLAAFRVGHWLIFLLALAAGFGIFVYGRFNQIPGWQWRLAGVVAGPIAWLLSMLQPILKPLAVFLRRHRPKDSRSGLYEKEDLLRLLKAQSTQTDSRFTQVELDIARGALSFGDKSVAGVMTPRAKAKMVAINEPIGPLLMDELHASGLAIFPVVKELSKSASLELRGLLVLDDLLEHGESGKVKDVLRPEVHYINESADLRTALASFVKAKTHLLIVVNDFEEVAGILIIEQVLKQILGKDVFKELEEDNLAQKVAKEPKAQDEDSQQ